MIGIDDHDYPILYEVEDLKGENIDGKFYKEELLKTKIPFVKIIDKIEKRKTVNGKKMVEISYQGWPSKFNEIISDKMWKDWLKYEKELD